MNLIKQKTYSSWLPSIFLVLIFLSEGFGKIAEKGWVDKSDIAKWVKFSILLLITPYLLKYWKKSIWFLILGLIFFLGQWTITYGFKSEMILTFSKYLFPIALLILFNKFNSTRETWGLLFNTFRIVLIVNSVLILLGFIFDIDWFYTYKWGRFGFSGLLNVSATATYFYVIGQLCFLLWYKVDFFKKWSTYLLIIATVLLGTKGALLGLIATLLAYFIFYSTLSPRKQKMIVFGFLGIGLLLFYMFFFQFGIFNEIREEEGLITSILSMRNELLLEETLPFIQQEWTWVNYLFGGYDDIYSRTQMGFLDVFYFWGILGGLLYLFIYYKEFVLFKLSIVGIYTVCVLLIIVFLSGNFFENASVAIYMIVFQKAISIYESSPILKSFPKS
ncbi:hypothetical protein [Aequorivita sediminis]|uniref:hypothetical protein n=1 Tax=Aequorivita sediminis TaxID=3073653 RepID=UPI0028B24201|nr:hypothetical protein [Aequorivita sp. F6058]